MSSSDSKEKPPAEGLPADSNVTAEVHDYLCKVLDAAMSHIDAEDWANFDYICKSDIKVGDAANSEKEEEWYTNY